MRPSPKEVLTTIRTSPEMAAKIRELAARDEESVCYTIRRLIRLGLEIEERKKTPPTYAEIAGTFRDLADSYRDTIPMEEWTGKK